MVRFIYCALRNLFRGAEEKYAFTTLIKLPMSPLNPFTDVPTAIEEFRAGRMVVIVDDEDRENEGDLTLAAEKVTPESH